VWSNHRRRGATSVSRMDKDGKKEMSLHQLKICARCPCARHVLSPLTPVHAAVNRTRLLCALFPAPWCVCVCVCACVYVCVCVCVPEKQAASDLIVLQDQIYYNWERDSYFHSHVIEMLQLCALIIAEVNFNSNLLEWTQNPFLKQACERPLLG